MRMTLGIVTVLGLAAASAEAQIVVNEFNTGTPDFLELRNTSGSAIDVSGWTVSTWYATASGGGTIAETPYTLPAGTIIQGGDFLVLQENGTPGSAGTLPKSISVGFNYFWTSTRTIEIAVFDNFGVGQDYVYLNWFLNLPTPNLPPGQTWVGDLNSGTGDEVRRLGDDDLDNATDWLKTAGSGTPGDLNPGQSACQFHQPYGVGCAGSGGFTPKIEALNCPVTGGQVQFLVHEGLGGSTAHLVFGFSQTQVPIFGGACQLAVQPVLPLIVTLPLGGSGPGNGSTILGGILPISASGLSFTMQAFVNDTVLPDGYSASEGANFNVP